MRRFLPGSVICLLLLATALLLSVTPRVACSSTTIITTGEISINSAWSGKVLVEKPLMIDEGITLTIAPGTQVRFLAGAGLTVKGTVIARGTSEKEILFTSSQENPSPGDWQGIRFVNAGEDSILDTCRTAFAHSITIDGSSPAILNCEISSGVKGLSIMRAATPRIESNRIVDMAEGGIEIILGANPFIIGNTLERCGPFGILANQESLPEIRGNTVFTCESGIVINRLAPPVRGNTLRKNRTGLLVIGGLPGLTLAGNTVSENKVGVVCQKFSSPVVENNRITGNGEGLVSYMGSSPEVRYNEISDNEKGIVCIQMSNPKIASNSIHSNRTGIYLHLSSYAIINGNNIYGNDMHIELDNMSSDWENKVRNKPTRGRQAQNLTQVQKGRTMPRKISENQTWTRSVDATGNWWGETGREMAEKGPEGNISSLKDYYDVPTRTYEGYEGEYVQDRIDYDGWLESKIGTAGIQPQAKTIEEAGERP